MEIKSFCSTNYGVTFPMSAKLEVRGNVGRGGRLMERYAPAVKLRDNGLMQDITDAL